MGGVLLTILLVLSWRQERIYAGPMAIWTDTLQKNPGGWMVHTNLGHALVSRGEPGDDELAWRQYQIAVQLCRRFPKHT